MEQKPTIDDRSPFRLGDWLIDPATGRVSDGNHEHKVEPRAMAVLVELARRPGVVLTREELESRVWAGMVVGYDSLAGAIIKLRKALGDDSKQPRYIETIPKRGYRLISAVTPAADSPAAGSVAPAATAATTAAGQTADATARTAGTTVNIRLDRNTLLLVALVIGTVLAGLLAARLSGVADRDTGQTDFAARRVIAVLPFENLSDDPQQDYFSDGITADLITDLSRVSGLSVIARNSVFVFKDTNTDLRKVRDELGADYAVEGSVRKIGDTVRISARLIDTASSINIWADRYDGALDNIFRFQDEATARIIDALAVKLTAHDRDRLAHKYSSSIEAYDAFLQGWQSLWLSTRQGMHAARADFLRAIELDPGFARAYANLALTHLYDHLHGWSDDDERALRLAHEYADRAIELDPGIPQVYWVKGFADIFRRDYQQALANAEKSIEVDPSFADGYGLLATILNYAGHPGEADVEMRKSMRLNPRYPAIYNVIHGEILFNSRDIDGAIEEFETALEINPEIEESRIWLAAAYAIRGDLGEAGWQLEQLRLAGRELSAQRLGEVVPFRDPMQRQYFIDGLVKAGVAD